MKIKLSTILTIITALLFYNCAGQSLKLNFLNDQNFPTGSMAAQGEIGGLSGIAYDEENKKLYAVSDDKGEVNPPRIHVFNIEVEEKDGGKKIIFAPAETIFLKTETGGTFAIGHLDLEGIALYGGNFLLSSEGMLKDDPANPNNKVQPEMLLFGKDGLLKQRWPLPAKFISQEGSGVRKNLVWEPLSKMGNSNVFWSGNEQPLKQDGPLVDINNDGPIRLIRMELANKDDNNYNLSYGPEYQYRIEKMPNPDNLPAIEGDNGLVDMIAINEKEIITLERSWNDTMKRNFIRVFHTHIDTQKANDISGQMSIQGVANTTTTKRLILDLDEIVPLLDKNFPRLDNIEAIC